MAKVFHTTDAQYDLPPLIEKEVGRIILRCGFIEHQLQQAIWHLLQITLPMGRIATRTPRVTDRLDMIRDLLIVRKRPLDPKELSALKSLLDDAFDRRDLFAHGQWTRGKDGKWLVIKAAGTWSDQQEAPVRSKRILPEALEVDLGQLRSITEALDDIIAALTRLRRGIYAWLPRPLEESPELLAQPDHVQGRKGDKLEPPNKPSRATAQKPSAKQRRDEALARTKRAE